MARLAAARPLARRRVAAAVSAQVAALRVARVVPVPCQAVRACRVVPAAADIGAGGATCRRRGSWLDRALRRRRRRRYRLRALFRSLARLLRLAALFRRLWHRCRAARLAAARRLGSTAALRRREVAALRVARAVPVLCRAAQACRVVPVVARAAAGGVGNCARGCADLSPAAPGAAWSADAGSAARLASASPL